MKLLTFIVALTATSAMAGEPGFIEEIQIGLPNMIECETASPAGAIQTKYSVADVGGGRITLTQTFQDQTYTTRLVEVSKQETALGSLFTGKEEGVMDAEIKHSIIVPNVLVNHGTEQWMEFTSHGIKSYVDGWTAGDDLGQNIYNEVKDLNCQAALIYLM